MTDTNDKSSSVVCDWSQTFAFACKGAGKWGLYLSFAAGGRGGLSEAMAAAPYLEDPKYFPFLLTPHVEMVILFDTREEMNKHFGMTVGEDGPTKSNPYKGPATIFACTCGPDGNLLGENT
jgi:hypothetical protein